jgi:hypothetical protein
MDVVLCMPPSYGLVEAPYDYDLQGIFSSSHHYDAREIVEIMA